ncbi:MAG TPA: GNAT family N-acetyltransferase [Acidimicrobiales bacterium]|nr:GNAT family N-acetyltransferase [Acidimicrobiales bacterium]
MSDGSETEVATGVGPGARATPPAYPKSAERDARIRNGEVVHVRPIRPDDGAMLVAFHALLSPQSIYLRFFNFHPVLSAREVERFTNVDYVDRLALVVLAAGRLVAVGRYDRLAGTDDAEVAFLVEDDYQHQGIGTLLADELARAARARGVRGFVADTLAENVGMLEMFRATGFPVRSGFEEGVVKVRFAIDPVPAYLDALRRREADRRIVSGPAGGAAC